MNDPGDPPGSGADHTYTVSLLEAGADSFITVAAEPDDLAEEATSWGVEEAYVNYTLGEVARRREAIKRTLRAEGLLDRNRAVPLSPLPLRIGLVTSAQSDAYNDVVKTLRESGYAFQVWLRS